VTINTTIDLIEAVNNIPAKDFNWKVARNLLVIFTLEALFLLIALQAVKCIRIENRYQMTNNESNEWLRNHDSFSSHLKPIGLGPKKFLNFYKSRVVLTARVFITLDTVRDFELIILLYMLYKFIVLLIWIIVSAFIYYWNTYEKPSSRFIRTAILWNCSR